KNTQLAKDIKNNTSKEEEYQKFIEKENRIIINKIGNNIVITIRKMQTLESKLCYQKEINLEKAYENWKKRVEILKRITKKFKEKDLNELKKQEEYRQTTLNHKCEA
ncbi:10782_t:CDS:2, partial [Gigaspora margarita]